MPNDFEVLVTAEEAWPAFERAVLEAEREIIAGFRIFDMRTKLLSAEGKAVGRDWFDLLAHVLNKGIRVDLSVSDFDPIMATQLHEKTWRTVRQAAALREVASVQPGQLNIRPVLHPAKAGLLPWLFFLPLVLKKKFGKLKQIGETRLKYQAVGLNRNQPPQLHTVSHHQKIAVIDGELLYVGGLDMNDRRFDTRQHDRPAQSTWSDVQVMMRGPEAADARKHLLSFAEVTAGTKPVPSCPHLKRTLSAPRRIQFPFLSPRCLLNEIEQAHVNAIRNARHLIYVETQFLRSTVIADALEEAAAGNPELTALFLLPALPDDVAFENSDGLDARFGIALQRKIVRRLKKAFADRITFATPVRPIQASGEGKAVLSGSPIIHVHNKVFLKDDDYALVGSANLNGRSMRWDTEVAVEVTKPERLALLKRRIFSHWWQSSLQELSLAPDTMQSSWNREIERNGVRRPEARKGFLVPYDPDKGSSLAQPLPGVTEDIV